MLQEKKQLKNIVTEDEGTEFSGGLISGGVRKNLAGIQLGGKVAAQR